MAPICHVATDIVAGATYAGYRFADQAVSELQANRPTHVLGLAERAGQYVHQLWHAVFAIVLLRQQRTELDSRRRAL